MNVLDYAAVKLGSWALRRLFGANCDGDIRQELPEDYAECTSCDAKRLINAMQDILDD